MSSYKTKLNKACDYCNYNYPSSVSKCPKCSLFRVGFNIPDRVINIKDIFIINLEKDINRINSFYYFLKKNKISVKNRSWNKFRGINGSSFSNIKREIENYPEDIKIKIRNHWNKKPGSIGCYLSHIKLWEYIYNNVLNEYTLILEDDIIFLNNGLINIENILKHSLKDIKNKKWDILYIGHGKLKGIKISNLLIFPDSRSKRTNTGLYGYIIRKSSIPKLLKIVKKFDLPFIDVHMKEYFGIGPDKINALFFRGTIIMHNNIQSSSRKKIDLITI